MGKLFLVLVASLFIMGCPEEPTTTITTTGPIDPDWSCREMDMVPCIDGSIPLDCSNKDLTLCGYVYMGKNFYCNRCGDPMTFCWSAIVAGMEHCYDMTHSYDTTMSESIIEMEVEEFMDELVKRGQHED